MLWTLFYFALSLAILACWNIVSRRQTRNRAIQVMHWLERALGGHGHVAGIQWMGPAEFQVPVRMAHGAFREARVSVRLKRHEFPLVWLGTLLRKDAEETLTFLADLDLNPTFSMQLQSMRWFARSSKNLDPQTKGWQFESAAPVVLTTRTEWQKQITTIIQSILSCEHRESLHLAFNRRSPHFSATLPLECIVPDKVDEWRFFDALRTIAEVASAKA